jgi:hypothetical protein
MGDVARLITWLIGVGFALASMGTLVEVRDALKKEAITAQKHQFSLGNWNRRLMNGK